MSDFSGLELRHAVYSARAGWRGARWAARIGLWRPVLASLVLWTALGGVSTVDEITRAASPVARVTSAVCTGHLNQQCHVANDGTGTPLLSATQPVTNITGWTAPLAWWLRILATFTTIGAIAVGMISVFSPSGRRRRPQQHGSIRDGIRSDWGASKRDVRRGRDGLRKAANWRARRRARRHVGGDQQYTPTGVEGWVLGHADPPKTRKAKKAAKGSARAERVELDAEWDTELRRIRAARTGHLDTPLTAEQIAEGAAVGDAMRVDAGGPTDRVEAWRDVIENPHEGPLPPAPPPTFVAAPSHATPEQAMANHHDAEALGVVFDTSNRADADEALR